VPEELPKTKVIATFPGNKNVPRGIFETLLIHILTFWLFFFTKREIEALLADAGLTHFPEWFPIAR